MLETRLFPMIPRLAAPKLSTGEGEEKVKNLKGRKFSPGVWKSVWEMFKTRFINHFFRGFFQIL